MSVYTPAEPSHLSKPSVQKFAESVAKQLDYKAGGNLTAIIKKMGGCVDIEDTLLTDPSQTGSLFVDHAKQFRIVVPSHTSPERDRFTVAHELGHFVLHYLWNRKKNPQYPEKVMAYRMGSERIEWEANWFAGAFLMPSDEFTTVYQENPGALWAVADWFKVSQKAAEVRAKDLGLLNA